MKLGKGEKKVLLNLIDNSRMAYSELARKTKLSRQTVQKNLQSLKDKGVIKKFTVVIDEEQVDIGLKLYIMISFKKQLEFEKAKKSLVYLKEISAVHHVLGRFDAVLEVKVKDSRHLTALLKKIQALEDILRTETLVVFETVKDDPNAPMKKMLEED